MGRRHKGIPSRASLNRDFPHQVVFDVPPGGLARLRDMSAFCAERDLKHSTMAGDRPPPPAEVCVYAFAREEDAELFHREFGGTRVTLKV